MLDTKAFGEELKHLGFSFYSGVPCSFLNNLINYAINKCKYVAAANEGDAVAIASGVWLTGRKSVVLMQNSGLTNAVSPLVSLNYPFQIPVLGFVSLRGEPGAPDEPQHELMGQITTQMLDLMQVKWQYLQADLKKAKQQLLQADQWIAKNRPFFFVVKKGTFTDEPLQKQTHPQHVNRIKSIKKEAITEQIPQRYEALRRISTWKKSNTVLIATTGKTGRELYEIEDAPNHLYMVGSMGCAGSLGLGMALTGKDLEIVVIDGDGSLLMRMGSLATNGSYNPHNMLHILLDNQAHDSTGGQSTVSHNTDFVEIAASCGYTKSIYIHNLEELHTAMREWRQSGGLTFLYMRISKGSRKQLGRPKIKPYEVKERLQTFIKNNSRD
ncbi:phosphonopyruvate decarboxylase [Marinithermofilum abyssi]|nr:phosphonopyruvate decarboxylase [Marinithermofilum abyssi]